MKNLQYSCVASAALWALFGTSTPASAVVMQATYTGLLNSTVDASGLFGHGSGNGALDGLEFIMSYIYETSGFVSGTDSPFPFWSYNQVYGGTIYDPDRPNPVLSATLTINGHSETFSGDFYGQAINRVSDTPDPSTDFSLAYHFLDTMFDDGIVNTDNGAYIFGTTNSLAIPLALDTPFSTDVSDDYNLSSYFILHGRRYVGGVLVPDYYAAGYFDVRHLTVSLAVPPPEVPLPAALPLFAAGLSAMGLLGWRKKRKAAFAD